MKATTFNQSKKCKFFASEIILKFRNTGALKLIGAT
jgi:hypothetical protein